MEKCLRPVPEVWFCMVVKNGPCQLEISHVIKTSDHLLIQWICGVKIKQQHSIEELRRRRDLQHIEDVLRWNRLRLSGHLYQQEEKSWAKKIMNFVVDAPTFWGRPKLRWKDVVNSDLRKNV